MPKGTYECRCHERMGNDFWFLPTDQCLFGKCNKYTTVGELIEDDPGIAQQRERDPIRGGVIS